MFLRFSCVLATGFLFVVIGGLAGCNKPVEDQVTGNSPEALAADATEGDYDPHDMPLTDEQKSQLREETSEFPAAVAKIAEFRDAIEEETADGIPENPHLVHQSLDKADLVLQWLPEIARNCDVPKEHWEEINTTANDVRTLFEQVHESIDNQQEPDFASVAEGIDQKIVRLLEIAQFQTAPTGEEG
jgi:hypothetical protein